MNTRINSTLLVALFAGAALSAGCSEREAAQTTGQINRGADKVAAATDRAASKAAIVLDDAAVTTKVKAAVLAEPGLKTLQIGVDTVNGVVTLSGVVDTPELKDRATMIAQNIDGVRSVIDNLSVKHTG